MRSCEPSLEQLTLGAGRVTEQAAEGEKEMPPRVAQKGQETGKGQRVSQKGQEAKKAFTTLLSAQYPSGGDPA